MELKKKPEFLYCIENPGTQLNEDFGQVHNWMEVEDSHCRVPPQYSFAVLVSTEIG